MKNIIKFSQFLNEEFKKLEIDLIDPDEIVTFYISQKLQNVLIDLKNDYKVAHILYSLGYGVQRKYLVKDPPNYFDVESDGTISFLKSRYFPEKRGLGEEWISNRRQKIAAKKAMKEIYNEAYINVNIKETDVAAFSTKWGLIYTEKLPEIVELRGKDILRAYNYTKECDKRFGYTCANFFQKDNNWGDHEEPKLDQYDIYVKNPENCGAVVAIEDGKIKARRSFQQGIQVEDIGHGTYQKGQFYTIYGNAYGIGGDGGKYDTMIIDYLKKKYNAAEMSCRPGTFVISMETRFRNYCPFDSMYVCFEKNLLSDSCPKIDGKIVHWIDTYHAQCPEKLVKQRIDEENAEKFIDIPEIKVKSIKKGIEGIKPLKTGRVVYRDKFGRFRKKTS